MFVTFEQTLFYSGRSHLSTTPQNAEFQEIMEKMTFDALNISQSSEGRQTSAATAGECYATR
jgi:hypothetical protein